jgi:hypothetical protein
MTFDEIVKKNAARIELSLAMENLMLMCDKGYTASQIKHELVQHEARIKYLLTEARD